MGPFGPRPIGKLPNCGQPRPSHAASHLGTVSETTLAHHRPHRTAPHRRVAKLRAAGTSHAASHLGTVSETTLAHHRPHWTTPHRRVARTVGSQDLACRVPSGDRVRNLADPSSVPLDHAPSASCRTAGSQDLACRVPSGDRVRNYADPSSAPSDRAPSASCRTAGSRDLACRVPSGDRRNRDAADLGTGPSWQPSWHAGLLRDRSCRPRRCRSCRNSLSYVQGLLLCRSPRLRSYQASRGSQDPRERRERSKPGRSSEPGRPSKRPSWRCPKRWLPGPSEPSPKPPKCGPPCPLSGPRPVSGPRPNLGPSSPPPRQGGPNRPEPSSPFASGPPRRARTADSSSSLVRTPSASASARLNIALSCSGAPSGTSSSAIFPSWSVSNLSKNLGWSGGPFRPSWATPALAPNARSEVPAMSVIQNLIAFSFRVLFGGTMACLPSS